MVLLRDTPVQSMHLPHWKFYMFKYWETFFSCAFWFPNLKSQWSNSCNKRYCPITIYIEAPNATNRARHPTTFSLLMTSSNSHGWIDCGMNYIYPWESQQSYFSIAIHIHFNLIVQFSSVTQSCLTLCDPMNRSTPGLPVHHQLPEFTQTHVHRVSDAIQPSHPLSSPSTPASNPSQHQGLFQWVNSSHEVAKVLEFQL